MKQLIIDRLNEIIVESRATAVGLAAYRLASGEELLIDADRPFHPASTIKVCVMMEAFRQARVGEISLDELVPVRSQFRSIVDGSPYSLYVEDDSEKELYDLIGQRVSRRELVRRMITVSSNVATNMLLEELDPKRVTAFMRALGAEDILVLRGLEDKQACRLGMNSVATAHGFMRILTKLARREVVSPEDSKQILRILSQQQFNEMIPAGVPEDACVAHKTGWTADYFHDVGVVYPSNDEAFVLCILTKGYKENEEKAAHAFVASLARAVYEEWVERGRT